MKIFIRVPDWCGLLHNIPQKSLFLMVIGQIFLYFEMCSKNCRYPGRSNLHFSDHYWTHFELLELYGPFWVTQALGEIILSRQRSVDAAKVSYWNLIISNSKTIVCGSNLSLSEPVFGQTRNSKAFQMLKTPQMSAQSTKTTK